MNGVQVAEELSLIDPELILIAITRDFVVKTKALIIECRAFEMVIPKNMSMPQIRSLFNILLATKVKQKSGIESRMTKKLEYDKRRAEEEKKKAAGEEN